jgi:hypothetical protein
MTEMRCMACRHSQHDVCIDVGCFCFTCMANQKDEYPSEYPTYLGGPLACLSSQSP